MDRHGSLIAGRAPPSTERESPHQFKENPKEISPLDSLRRERGLDPPSLRLEEPVNLT